MTRTPSGIKIIKVRPLCAVEVAVYNTPVLEERGDRQMRQKARVLTLIGVLTSSAGG
jgi:hypothetical protein